MNLPELFENKPNKNASILYIQITDKSGVRVHTSNNDIFDRVRNLRT